MQRTDGTVGEPRIHAQREVGGAYHFIHYKFQGMGQALSAKFQGRIQGRPTPFHKLSVGFLEPLRGFYIVGFRVVMATFTVTVLVGWLNNFSRQFAGLVNNCGNQVRRGIRVLLELVKPVDTQYVKQQKAKITCWSLLLHEHSQSRHRPKEYQRINGLSSRVKVPVSLTGALSTESVMQSSHPTATGLCSSSSVRTTKSHWLNTPF